MRSHIDAIGRLILFALLAASADAAEPEFVSLFDGKTLDGWTIKCKPADKQEAAAFWKVDNGSILADSMGHKRHDYVWLTTNAEYNDFVLRLRFQVAKGIKGNSGVQIRSRYDDKAGYLDGPQVDIHPPGPWRTGMIWDETRGVNRWLYPDVPRGKWVNESMAKPELKFFYSDQGSGWNDLEITAKALTLTAVLNGVKVMEYDGNGVLDDDTHKEHNVGIKGVIALQIHRGDQVKIRFKDVWIKEL